VPCVLPVDERSDGNTVTYKTVPMFACFGYSWT
jgi:hypothetical protein